MKTLKYFLTLALIMFLLNACEYDNYDEPNVTLSGQLKYDGENLNTRQNVLLKLYQYREDGYVAAGARSLDVRVDQEGKYSALLYPGRYKMVIYADGGINYIYDWLDFPKNSEGKNDTLYFDLNGSKTLDFNVRPYYKINDFKAFYRNDSIISNFSIERLTDIETPSIVGFRQVSMRLSPTMHVNNDTPLSFTKTGVTVNTPIEIKGSLKDYYSNTYYKNNFRDYVYVRIAVSLRVSGQEYIYSNVVQVKGIPQETINKLK